MASLNYEMYNFLYLLFSAYEDARKENDVEPIRHIGLIFFLSLIDSRQTRPKSGSTDIDAFTNCTSYTSCTIFGKNHLHIFAL